MTVTELDIVLENEMLKKEFARRGLDLDAVWQPTPGEPIIENRQLTMLLTWADAYRACPNRLQLKKRGYEFPPVEPGIEPETDWLRFERWMQGKSLSWRFEQIAPPLEAPNGLTDSQIAEALDALTERLAARGVVVDIVSDDVPLRLVYECLRRELKGATFEHLGPNTYCHIGGCSGWCPGCFQRPWCDNGVSSCWVEDEDAGCMVLPPETLPYVSASPVSLEVLRKAERENAPAWL